MRQPYVEALAGEYGGALQHDMGFRSQMLMAYNRVFGVRLR